MSKIVRIKNMPLLRVPDDATDDEIQNIVDTYHPMNKQQASPQPSNKRGYLDMLANNPGTNAILGAGDALQHNISNALELLPGVDNLPRAKSASGTAYDVGDIAGNIGAFIGGGELLGGARAASEAIPLAGRLAKSIGGNGLSGITRRAIGTGMAGALENPEERTTGAEKGVGLSLLGELLPSSVKGIRKAAEFVNPKKYTEGLVDSIKNVYKNSVKEASNEYKPVLEKYGEKNILSPAYSNIDKELVDTYFTPNIKKLHKEFLKEPTLQKAHDLQSQMFSEGNKLNRKNPDAITNNTLQALQQGRKALQSDILDSLNVLEPNAASQYQKAAQVFKEKVAPHRSNSTIYEISKGKMKTITPKKLMNSLVKSSEKGEIPQGHYLSQALEDLSNKIERGNAYKHIGAIAGGGAIGNMIAPGVVGGAGGAALAEFLSPAILGLAQNRYVTKNVSKLNLPYELLKKGLIANNLANR